MATRSLNQVMLIGNLTRDPETRALPSGKEVCRFGLALNANYRSADGEEVEQVDFVEVSAWEGLGRVVQTYCHKGKQIFVSGRLRSSSWEKDGQTRSKLEVVARDVILLGSPGASSPTTAPAATEKSTPKTKKATKIKPPTEAVDYEVEDFDYDQEGVNPQDIPF